MSLADRFVAFAEAGNQQRLALRDGSVLQITVDAMLVSTGAGESGKDNWVKLEEIDESSLAYWDARQQTWLSFLLP